MPRSPLLVTDCKLPMSFDERGLTLGFEGGNRIPVPLTTGADGRVKVDSHQPGLDVRNVSLFASFVAHMFQKDTEFSFNGADVVIPAQHDSSIDLPVIDDAGALLRFENIAGTETLTDTEKIRIIQVAQIAIEDYRTQIRH